MSSLHPIMTPESHRANSRLSRGLIPGSCEPDPLLHSLPVFTTTCWLLRPLLETLRVSEAPRKEKQGNDRR